VTRNHRANNLAKWVSSHGSPIELSLKLESEQSTGSFKARGAVVAIGALLKVANAAGVRDVQAVTASTGNHGKATARAVSLWRSGEIRGFDQGRPSATLSPARVHVPSNVAPHKLKALRDAGADIIVCSKPDCAIAESEARSEAEATARPAASGVT